MKKLLSVLLAIVSVFTFVFFAVGSGDDNASIDEDKNTSGSVTLIF